MITADIIEEISKRRQEYRKNKQPVPKLEIHMNSLAYHAIIQDPEQWMPPVVDDMVNNGKIVGCAVVLDGNTGIMPGWYVKEK